MRQNRDASPNSQDDVSYRTPSCRARDVGSPAIDTFIVRSKVYVIWRVPSLAMVGR
jgi:hypothetical protein